MLQPGCSCCDCPACSACSGGSRPVRWMLDMSGMSNGGGLTCTCPGGVVTIDCTRQHGKYLLACNSGSFACYWDIFDPPLIPRICSNSGGGSNSLNLSYASGSFYLVFGEALYKYTAASHDCTTDMTLTRSTDFGYSLTTCCQFPGSVTLSPG